METENAATQRAGADASRESAPAGSKRPPREPPLPAAPPPPARRSRFASFVGTVALVVALASAAALAYLYVAYFHPIMQQGQDGWAERLQAAEQALDKGARDADARDARVDGRFAELRAEQERLAAEQKLAQDALAEARAAMADAVAETMRQAPPDGREWKLAEAAYLLRIANHRLAMERDAAGARSLLVLADGILAEQGDFSLHEVRVLLADETAALRAFEGVDVTGVYLRLEALKNLLPELPLRLPEYQSGEAAGAASEPADDASVLAAVARRLGDLVRFRRHDGPALRPLLAPEQAEYLEQHLRLALGRAQLALLRGDQAIFQSSLDNMRDWLQRFVDAERGAAGAVADELDALLALRLDAPPPDISGSLARLGELRRARPEPAQ